MPGDGAAGAGRRVAIVQSNYIPWKGYFDLVAGVDLFVLLDEVQYTKRDWRNRNRIKTAQGAQWLTVPVQVKGRYHQRIDETLVSDAAWAERHWATLTHAYRAAPHFAAYAGALQAAYEAAGRHERLSDVNRTLLEAVMPLLGVDTPLRFSTELERPEMGPDVDPTQRLVDLCVAAGATEYVSGPAARAYLDPAPFEAHGVRVRWASYDGYPEYPQPHPPFRHDVTVLDLLFSTGPDAGRYLLREGVVGD
ncbi:MAG TPA: WbqC family protein [Capillimicrobium sp.]|nr:WbqC family protein [Capillimicrobium sp.]